MTACDTREELGGYVLDGLTAAERAAFETHLTRCPACRRELAQLEGLPALLALADDAPPPPPERVRARLLAAAGARRARRRWLGAVAAVAVLAALLGGAATTRIVPATTSVIVALNAVEPFDTDGWAVIRERRGSVTIDLELEGLAPLPPGAAYEAWFSTHDEQLVSLGELLPDGAGSVAAELEAAGTLADYRSFWVTAEPAGTPGHDGPTVVYARLPPPER